MRGGEYRSAGIQIGSGYTEVRDVMIDDVDGDGFQVVKQFGGPNKVVSADRLLITRCTRKTISINEHAPNDGDSRGTVTLGTDIYTDDGLNDSRPAHDAPIHIPWPMPESPTDPSPIDPIPAGQSPKYKIHVRLSGSEGSDCLLYTSPSPRDS